MSTKVKKVIWTLTLLFGVLIFVLWLVLNYSAPGPVEQEILGVSIGHWEFGNERAYISGKRLTCQPVDDADIAFNSVCTLEVQGETLTIWASRNSPESNMMFGGRCVASYGDEQLTCDIGSRHVHIPWFAFVEQPAALDGADMAQIRQHYVLENLPETFFVMVIRGIGMITAVLAIANLFVLLWHKIQSKLVLFVFGGLPVGVVFFYVGMLGAFWLTSGFFD